MPALDPKAAQARFKSRNREKLRLKAAARYRGIVERRERERLADITWMNKR